MSPAGNNNGLINPISTEHLDDTEPSKPLSPEIIFIENLANVLMDNETQDVLSNLDVYQKAVESLIKNGFLELAAKTFPELTNTIQGLNSQTNGMIGKMINEQLAGSNGLAQLSAVINSMAMGIDTTIFKNLESITIIKNVVVQHILEIISDNLDEHGLLSDNILTEFITILVCQDKGELPRLMEHAMHTFQKELSGKDLRIVFSVGKPDEYGNNPKQDALESKIKALVGDTAYYNLVPMLLFLNLGATRQAFEGLEKFANSADPFISKIAKHSQKSVIDRYSSQIEKREPNLTAEQEEKVRTKEILTTFTYTAFILAYLLSNERFKNEIQGLNYEEELIPVLTNAGSLIRFANDAGGLLKTGPTYIRQAFLHLKRFDSLDDSSLNEADLKKRLLADLRSFTVEDKKNFYTFIKDLSTNETNSLLDVGSKAQKLSYFEYLDLIEERLMKTNTAFESYLKQINSLSSNYTELYNIVMSFVMYCWELYTHAEDFDSEGAIKALPNIFNSVAQTLTLRNQSHTA